jgi:hypothetical protein
VTDEVIVELHEIKDRNAVALGLGSGALLDELRAIELRLRKQGIQVVELVSSEADQTKERAQKSSRRPSKRVAAQRPSS